ncbi:MAG: Polyhydroxyalkanoic acid synthase [Micavibrio sp.]|nr:Polyhydroxyalkanoic acid synthase [Micavibrio sp.]
MAENKAKSPKKPKRQIPNSPPLVHPDPAALGAILAQTSEKLHPLMQEFMDKIDWNAPLRALDPMNVQKAYVAFFQKLYEDPERLTGMQIEYAKDWMTLWQESAKSFLGEQPARKLYTPEKTDKRFKSEKWDESALFDFIKQSYLLTSQWMNKTVHETRGLDQETQRKVEFYTKQFVDAMSPSNFLLTNPDVIQATLDSKGENLIKGFQNMMEDLERGKGQLKISTTDYSAFELGRNVAATPGQVVHRNDLIELLQYTPTTPDVYKTPVLIIPPWINKFYILDLRPENSLIKFLVDQGHTVFVVSWANPSAALNNKSFSDYMHEGILDALTAIERETGEKQANVMGYCIGGTLLTTTLAWLEAKGEAARIRSATFLTTLIDFRNSGDLQVFIDDEQIAALEASMKDKGYFDAKSLKDTFSLLRANDLIWSFVVNNYLMGKEPFPFDLLYWNDDSTNMPANMHSFYLRNMYRDNKLIVPGGIEIDGTAIDVHKIKTPSYFLSTKEDHIAPWRATYAGSLLFEGPVKFTLSGSGHVAGVINPPTANKYGYWTSAEKTALPETWFERAVQHDGSWWSDWKKWIETYNGEKIPARQPKHTMEPAPGSYVRVKAN